MISILSITAILEIEGVSDTAWTGQKALFDQVFKEALIMTIANHYITINQVNEVFVKLIDTTDSRRLTLRVEEDQNISSRLRRKLSEDSAVEISSRVLAGNVIGDTSETVSARIKAKTDSGEFTRNLRMKANELGATELEEATVEEYQAADSGGGTKSHSSGLGVGAITGIAFGVFAAGVLIAVAYFYSFTMRQRKNKTVRQVLIPLMCGTIPRGLPNHGITPISETTINPMAMQQMAPPAPDQEEDLIVTTELKVCERHWNYP